MKLAVLGTDSDILALVAAALAAGHEIGWLGDVRPADQPVLERMLAGVAVSSDWESLLDHRLADAVLVGRGTTAEPLRAEQLKRLVAGIMPVLAVHPVGTSVLAYYELDMARHEVHGVLRHYSPLTGSPAVAELAEWVRTGDSDVGVVHQIICERHLDDCSRENVIRHLARDVEVLREIAGTIRTVSAVGPRMADSSYASLQVQMTGAGAATLRWAVAPSTNAEPRAVFTLVGERGTVQLDLHNEHPHITIVVGGAKNSNSTPPFDPARTAIEALAAALPANGTEQSETASTWQSATAAMEVADTIELSLQKGRTIEVHQQRLTEQLAFRGTMAAFGCGLLLFTLFVLVAAGILGDLVFPGLRLAVGAFWPVALLAVLALFLLMQAAPWLVKRRRPDAAPADERKS